jgi:DNA-binding transcriptional regulator YiaG
MKIQEVEELLTLKKWTKRRLAAKLLLSEDTVYRWFHEKMVPRGPALLLMRHWLEEARKGDTMPAAG